MSVTLWYLVFVEFFVCHVSRNFYACNGTRRSINVFTERNPFLSFVLCQLVPASSRIPYDPKINLNIVCRILSYIPGVLWPWGFPNIIFCAFLPMRRTCTCSPAVCNVHTQVGELLLTEKMTLMWGKKSLVVYNVEWESVMMNWELAKFKEEVVMICCIIGYFS